MEVSRSGRERLAGRGPGDRYTGTGPVPVGPSEIHHHDYSTSPKEVWIQAGKVSERGAYTETNSTPLCAVTEGRVPAGSTRMVVTVPAPSRAQGAEQPWKWRTAARHADCDQVDILKNVWSAIEGCVHSPATSRYGKLSRGMPADNQIPDQINEADWERWAKPTGLFFSTGPLKFRWDSLVMVLILYSCSSVPFRLGMNHPPEGVWWCVEVAVSFVFIADMIINFNTAYSDGDLFILNRSIICANYMRGWFVLDLTSAFPFELVDWILVVIAESSTSSSSPGSLKALRALRLIRIMRLLRLMKLQTYIDAIEDALNLNLQILQLVKVVCGLMYLTHIIGCFWFFLANEVNDAPATWLETYDDGSGLDASVWQQYLISIYWALTTLTTVGYGDITPTNDVERLYSLLTLLTGALVFGYLLSTVSELVNNADPNKSKVHHKLTEIKHYLRWHRFPTELATRVKKSYEFYYAKQSAMREEDVTNDLAPALKRDVQAYLLSRTVHMLPLFKSGQRFVTLEVQLQVHAKLKPLMREAKETISDALEKGGEGGLSLYFVRRGTIAARGDLPNLTFFEIDSNYDTGAFLGEEALMLRQDCAGLLKATTKCTYQATTRCELYALAVADLFDILTSTVARLEQDPIDALAKVIWKETRRRARWRAFMVRLAWAHQGNKNDTHVTAALHLQAQWLLRTAARIPAPGESNCDLKRLLPGLYAKNYVGGLFAKNSVGMKKQQADAPAPSRRTARRGSTRFPPSLLGRPHADAGSVSDESSPSPLALRELGDPLAALREMHGAPAEDPLASLRELHDVAPAGADRGRMNLNNVDAKLESLEAKLDLLLADKEAAKAELRDIVHEAVASELRQILAGAPAVHAVQCRRVS